MRIKILVLIVGLCAIFCSCEKSIEIDEDAVKQEILIIMKNSESGWNEGNIEKFMQSYLKSDSLRFASGGDISYGWQTVFERYKKGYPDKATLGNLTFSNMDVTIISAEAAMVFGKWQLKRKDDQPRGLFTLIFRKTPNGWRIIHDHTSSAKTED